MKQWQSKQADDHSWRFLTQLDRELIDKVAAKVNRWLQEELALEKEQLPRRRPVEK